MLITGMNVIMPTGMISMHTDPKLSLSSQKTAVRGKKVLASLKTASPNHETEVKEICEAIFTVATTTTEESEDEKVQVSISPTFLKNYSSFFPWIHVRLTCTSFHIPPLLF